MSTRSHIAFYKDTNQHLSNFDALIYRHCDGYPDDVLPILVPFLKKPHIRGILSDPEFLSARTLQHLINSYDGITYGISKEIHGDIDYFYAVFGDSYLKVFEVNILNKRNTKINFKKDFTCIIEKSI